ncbi:protein OS-9-like [Mizuhopecten yessoensis]|uniref:Protein OS-9 n=1 Tax=Mizuhopecten yessoensis TaxID=6573 RepID=A0A210PYZ5_MIZYE|nr:protein OS-9-like [Mizuhopecten yessoensis]OWF41703.1 Protein OS-9 [Mizuhopecten yessoensis]
MATKTDGLLVAFLFIYFIRKCHPADGFLDIEELKSVHYGLDIISEPVVSTQTDTASSSNNIQVTSKYGQHYRCSFPNRMEADKKKEEEEKVAMETGIPELLKPLETGPCLFKNKDWWSYEFCYGKYIRQFHIEDGKIVGEVTFLGYYESEFDWNNQTDQDKRVKNYNRLNRYHSQQYINGTRCDLTGRPRKTEVRFVCEEGAGDTISRIDEPETCVYILKVHTTKICHHPYLKPPTKNTPVPITCQPLLSEIQFTEYKQQQLEQQRLKEESERKLKEKQEQEKQARLKRQKLQQEQQAKLKEQSDKSSIQKMLKSPDISWKDEDSQRHVSTVTDPEAEPEDTKLGSKDTQTGSDSDDENLEELMGSSLGNNKQLEKLLRNSLNEAMKEHTEEEGDASLKMKPHSVKVVHTMDELKEAVQKAQGDAEAYLQSHKEEEEEGEIGTSTGAELEDDSLQDKMFKLKKLGGVPHEEFDEDFDETELDMIKEFNKDLEEMDTLKLSQYKEFFRKNKKRFLSVKKRIQESMMQEFDNIISEAGEELGMTDEELNTDVDRSETFSHMSKIHNKLLDKLDKTEKDIRKVDKEISMLKEKSYNSDEDVDETEDESDDEDENLVSGDLKNKVKGPVKSQDDRVKIRVTKVSKSDYGSLQAKQTAETEKLEKEVKEGLKEAGLDLGGGKIQVKIITAGYQGDEDSVHVLSDEESKSFKNMIVSILEGDSEAAREEQQHNAMEQNYNFVWEKNKKKEDTLPP